MHDRMMMHAGPVGKLEAPAGTRRIRRTITHTLPSGEKASREVIITDQEKVRMFVLAWPVPLASLIRFLSQMCIPDDRQLHLHGSDSRLAAHSLSGGKWH